MKPKYFLIPILAFLLSVGVNGQKVDASYYKDLVMHKHAYHNTIIGWSENNLLAFFHVYSLREPVGDLLKMDIINLKTGQPVISIPVEDGSSYIYDHIELITNELIKNSIVLYRSDISSFPGIISNDTLNYRIVINDESEKGAVELYFEKSKKRYSLVELSKIDIQRFLFKGYTINPFTQQLIVFYYLGQGNTFNEIADFKGETIFVAVDMNQFQ
jgi:hypothetical protein